jgi:cell division protein FtsW
MLEPDMGTTLVVVALAITMYFLAGYPLRHFVLVGGVGIVVGIIFIVTSSYRLDRVKTFFNPAIDPQGSSYHIRQVLLALGSGGMTGVGIGRSRQKYEYLPEATTDSIFAVAGEELGFIGAGLLILAFLYLLSLIFQLATHTHDSYSKLLVAGVGAWFSLQFILNLAAMVALTPLTGVPLPLVSYGGSALVTMLAGIGIVLAVARTEKL